MEITITVDDGRMQAQLVSIQRRIEAAMIAATEDATSHLERQLTTYPAKRTGSKYVRTNTLRGSWDVTQPVSTGDTVTARVFSNANATMTRSGVPYSRYVQDRDMQATIHQGRWTNTVQTVAERSTAFIEGRFAARIAAITGG
jgi:hypothetical protein